MPAPVKSLLAEEWSKDPLLDPTKYPLLSPPLTADTTLQYAPLVEIDLTHFDDEGEKPRLEDQLHYAVRDVGFYCTVLYSYQWQNRSAIPSFSPSTKLCG